MTTEITYRIKSFRANNLLRLSVVEITPKGDVVTLAGKNGQGKSSVLDSIMMGLEGPRAEGFPAQPIRRGADRGVVTLDLGSIIVERTFTAGGDRVEVRTPDGAAYKKPQALLDELFTAISFDPLAFTRQGARDQSETLRRLVGLDFTDLDQRREKAFSDRTEAARDGKAIKARLDKAPGPHADAPAEPESISALTAELERRNGQIAEKGRLQRALEAEVNREKACSLAEGRAAKEVSDLEAKLADARKDLLDIQASVARATVDKDKAKWVLDAHVVDDVFEVRNKLDRAEATNRKVRENRERGEIDAELAEARGKWDDLDAKVKALDQERAATIAAAAFPVPGLSFGADGVTLDGIPFAQASTAQKIRVSLEVGIALNPRLRVLFVRDGSLLDEDGLALIAQMAAERDCQIWLEDARSNDPTAVVLEDGHVRGAPPESFDVPDLSGLAVMARQMKASGDYPTLTDADLPPAVAIPPLDVRPLPADHDSTEPHVDPTAPPPLPSTTTPVAAPSGDLFERTESGTQVRRIAPPPAAPPKARRK